MSFVDLDNLPPAAMIAHYVIECRGQALFLPYQDYALITEWLAAAPDPEALLLVLSEVLPPFFGGPPASAATGRRAKSLVGVHKLVLSRLKDLQMHLTES